MLQSPFNERVEGSRSTAAGKRPKLSLASLIGQAILASDGCKARLSAIYEWISDRYPDYYRMNSGGWQNSIRHNLTINKAFIRLPKEDGDAPGKGAFWTIHPEYLHQFKDGIFHGKIRGSEYSKGPSTTKQQRSKRASLSDLPSLSMDRFSNGSGFISIDAADLSHSTQSLIEPRGLSSDDYGISAEDFGYPQQPMMPQPQPIPRFLTPQAAQIPFGYYTQPPNPQQLFYNVVTPQMWQQAATVPTQQPHGMNSDGACECSYCVSINNPMSIQVAQVVADELPSMVEPHVEAQEVYSGIPPGSQFHSFYSTTVGNDVEEIAIAHIQQQFGRTGPGFDQSK